MTDNDYACRRNQQIHDAATILAEDETAYHLARQLVLARDRIVALEAELFQRHQQAIDVEWEGVSADTMRDWSAMAEDFDAGNKGKH